MSNGSSNPNLEAVTDDYGLKSLQKKAQKHENVKFCLNDTSMLLFVTIKFNDLTILIFILPELKKS